VCIYIYIYIFRGKLFFFLKKKKKKRKEKKKKRLKPSSKKTKTLISFKSCTIEFARLIDPFKVHTHDGEQHILHITNANILGASCISIGFQSNKNGLTS
jgi:hypothetical protein